jgi:hypothetical protein
MSLLTTCYGPDIEALADEDGGIETVTTEGILEFGLRQWKDVAATLGFTTPLARVLSGIQHARGGLLGLHATALAAFEAWHKERPVSPKIPPAVRALRARARQDVLLGYAGQHPDRLWMIDEPAPLLQHGACFERGPATALSGRAFQDDSAATYFHPARTGKPQPPCGWEGPVFLSLGTFPWVYGGRLYQTPPGLDWDAAGGYSPAGIAMRLCASLWQPEGNLRQDARAIVFAYRHYRQASEKALGDVPPWNPKTAVPGELYRQGLTLRAEQASLQTFTRTSPFGPLAASAHNYIIRRFAAFFALRRSLLLNAQRLSAEQKQAIEANADPCLRSYAPKDLTLKLSP